MHLERLVHRLVLDRDEHRRLRGTLALDPGADAEQPGGAASGGRAPSHARRRAPACVPNRLTGKDEQDADDRPAIEDQGEQQRAERAFIRCRSGRPARPSRYLLYSMKMLREARLGSAPRRRRSRSRRRPACAARSGRAACGRSLVTRRIERTRRRSTQRATSSALERVSNDSRPSVDAAGDQLRLDLIGRGQLVRADGPRRRRRSASAARCRARAGRSRARAGRCRRSGRRSRRCARRRPACGSSTANSGIAEHVEQQQERARCGRGSGSQHPPQRAQDGEPRDQHGEDDAERPARRAGPPSPCGGIAAEPSSSEPSAPTRSPISDQHQRRRG